METVAIPVVWLVSILCLVAGVVGGWFAARQYDRDLQRGMNKQEAVNFELGKVSTATNDLQAQVKTALAPSLKVIYDEIQKLKTPPSA